MSSGRISGDQIQEREQLTNWINKHKNSFIAHAVWQDNVDGVLSSGYVEPAEFQLRKKHQVSFERFGQYGQRGILNIENILKSVRSKETIYPPNPVTIELDHTVPLSCALKFVTHLDDAIFAKISTAANGESFAISLRNGKASTITRRDGSVWKSEISLNNLPLASYKDTEIRGIYSTYPLQIAIDCCSDDPIDKRLSHVWEANKDLYENLKELHCDLLKYRYAEIDRSTLCSSVRAGYNEVYWSYGDVVVLRGNPEKILSAYNLPSDYKTEDTRLQPGQEVFLLEPFENGGEFFLLDLKQEDTIIIGPQSILSQYQHRSDVKFFAFENMDSSQLDFFKAPQEIRPKNTSSYVLQDTQQTPLAAYSLLAQAKLNDSSTHEKITPKHAIP